ncbi:MAG: exo-beta-N-acetylmuramidase NamZ family protein [Gemmatimonadales bacterium]
MHRSLVLLGLWGWSLGCSPPPPTARVGAPAKVRPGIDVLLSDSASLVRGRRVGLVTNQSGVDARGTSDVTRLRDAGVDLVALFSPEHGFRGAADPGAAVASSRDSATGLPIYSLYGRSSAPTDEMLEGIDVILVDLQDAGARYYTYLYTTAEVMKAAARRSIPVVVLDRPDPIGGAVGGNVLDRAFASPVGYLEVPMRHGMTLGELARLARSDLSIEGSLVVVPVAGWRRGMAFDETGLSFVPPSPNLRSLESLFHYPGLCLFEGTNLSVGRGSDAPFEQIGAPWLDTTRVLAAMHASPVPGVRFMSVRFTPARPGDGKYADTVVPGIRLAVTDRATYDPTATAVQLLAAVRATSEGRFAWIEKQFDRLAGGPELRQALDAGTDPAAIVRGWAPALERFRERRRGALIYPE